MGYGSVIEGGHEATDRRRDMTEQTRLDHYLRADSSFGKGGAIGEVVQVPAMGDAPAHVAGVIVDVRHVERTDEWIVTYKELTDDATYFGSSLFLDFATQEQLAYVGRRLARLQGEKWAKNAREFDAIVNGI